MAENLPRWKRLWRFVLRIVALVPLTWRGGFFIAISVFLFYLYGLQHYDWILLVLGGFGFVLVVLSVVSVGLSALWSAYRIRRLNRDRSPQAIHTDTACSAVSGFLLPRLWLPFLDFSCAWQHPVGALQQVPLYPATSEEMRFSRRGWYEEVHRSFTVRDLFGLASVTWERIDPQEVEVLPHPQAHPPSSIRALIDGDGRFVPGRPRVGDRVDTRAYIPGDPVRYIHWKLFARTGQPVVRIPEPSAVSDRQVAAYLICDELDEFAAEVARWSIDNGGLGEKWQFGADGCAEVATDSLGARRVLSKSGCAFARLGRDLERFLELCRFDVAQHRLILFASGHVAAWLPQVLPWLQRYTPVISLVIASEYMTTRHAQVLAEKRRTPWWVRFILVSLPQTPQTPEVLWRTLQQLSQDGMQLQILHRPELLIASTIGRKKKAAILPDEPLSPLLRELPPHTKKGGATL